jgi:F-type H+-transporting ATPase subunit a
MCGCPAPPRRSTRFAIGSSSAVFQPDMSPSVLSQFVAAKASRGGRWIALVAFLCLLIGFATPALAAEALPAGQQVEGSVDHGLDGDHGDHGHHGLPPAAPEIPGFKIGPLHVTNSMVVTWVVALTILLLARTATRTMKEIPDGAQNFWEWLVESLYDFLGTIMGSHLARKTFWFFATVFVFTLFANWMGLIPGVGTIGWGTPNEAGAITFVSTPLFRGVGADLNMTLAMALIFFGCWIVWALQSNGIGGTIVHLFGNPARGEMKGVLAIMMAVVFAFVGLLEVISILFRPVSLSFRLYGNIFAGENLLESMAAIVPPLAWLIPIPFYFLELIVGLVQALVFMLLTAVFTVLICSHGDDHHETADGHH